jgi:hypothetical protein
VDWLNLSPVHPMALAIEEDAVPGTVDRAAGWHHGPGPRGKTSTSTKAATRNILEGSCDDGHLASQSRI